MNSRAKAQKAVGILTMDVLRDRIFASAGCCEWCGRSIVYEEFEVDHIISLSQQGQNMPQNLAIACVDCNRRKSNKHPARFAAEIAARQSVRTQLVQRILAESDLDGAVQQSFLDAPVTHESLDSINSQDAVQLPYNWSSLDNTRD